MPANFFPHSNNKDTDSIDIVVYFRAKRFKRGAGISVPREFWLKEEQRCSESARFPEGREYNKSLKKQYEAVRSAEAHYIGSIETPSQSDFWGAVDKHLLGESKGVGGLCSHFKVYLEDTAGTRKLSTTRTFRSILARLEEYERKIGKTIYFRDINDDFYRGFQRFLYSSSHGAINPRGYSNNYFGRIMKVVKIVYNDAARKGVHSLPPLNFKNEDHVADTIYLTPDELRAMLAVELRHPGEIAARAKFVIGANTGLRISDFNNLDNVNIGEKYITVTTKKTGQKVIVPINGVVRELLGVAGVFEPLADQYINRTIKQIAKDAGIVQSVEVTKHIAGRRITEVMEKWQLVSSHTARRSFATNAYKAGVPTLAIMKITGHTTEKSFLRYIKISKEENAELMAEHEFFKG